MRAVLISAVLLLGLAQPALAAPAVSAVKVSIGPDLADKVDEIGKRDLDSLAADLQRTIERRVPRAQDGGVLTLVIDDARPNRPTAQQLMTTQGLSMESFGNGGAKISGDYVDPSGQRTPIAYSWYGDDIRWARYSSTWRDAEDAFDRLADRLAKDQFSVKR
jgi:hypothetical protein